MRVESSKEEGKGYSLWELMANAWECPQAPKKWGKAAPKAQIWREMRGLERWELGENGMLWPQPVREGDDSWGLGMLLDGKQNKINGEKAAWSWGLLSSS